jgi:hypothetical protein
MHITFDPHIPLALWAPLALAAVALLAWYAAAGRRRLPARRWWPTVALMALAAAVPLVVLLNPTWQERIPPPPGKPLVTVLVDRSASMATRDAGGGQSRYQAAVAMAAATARELADRYEVRVRSFAETSEPVAAETLAKRQPAGEATDLAEAIQTALDDQRPQGQSILLLSDGVHNVGGRQRLHQSVEKAKATASPIYTKTFGGPAAVSDIEVSLQQPQELAFIGQRVTVAAGVRQRGSLAAKTELTLLLDDKPVETHDVAIKADGAVEHVFHVSHKRSGLYRYEVRSKPLPGEVTVVNNAAPLLLRVIDQPVRVLLLEGKPYWDTKFLVRTLSADPSIELTSVVRLSEGRLLQRKLPRAAMAEGTGDRGQGSGTREKKSEISNPKSEISNPKSEISNLKSEISNLKSPASNPQSPAPNPSAAGPHPNPLPKGEGTAASGEQWTIEKDAGKYLSDADALAAYQIVILGRDAELFLTDEALVKLRKWIIDAEGSLVCYRGRPAEISQRLGELMPVRWTAASEARFRVQLTGAGEALRWLAASGNASTTLADMPSLAATTQAEPSKAMTVVLATSVGGASGKPAPVVSYQPVGNGRVVVVEGAGMWRWAFLAPEHQQREEVYGSLWRSLVRWLASNVGLLPSQRMALRADKLTFNTDENVTATLLVRDWSGNPPKVELAAAGTLRVPSAGSQREPPKLHGPGSSADGTRSVPATFACVPRGNEPGQYYVGLGRLPEGRYALRVVGAPKDDLSAVTAFDVRGNLTERLDLDAQGDQMRRIARQSGGAALDTVDPRQLARQFDEHLHRTRPERMAQTTAWDRWWALAGALALWGAAWGLRRSSGLV